MKNHIRFLQKVKKRVGPILLAAAALFAAAASAVPAFAASSVSATAAIPVQQTIEGGSGTFSYVLTPEEQESPMPTGSSGGSYTLTLTDTQESEIDIPCTAPGTWYYSLELQQSSDSAYTYDVMKYRIGVQCVNGGDGTYRTNITALADGSTEDRKATSAHFTITQSQPENPNPGTGDPSVTKYIRRTQRDADGNLISPSEDVDFHFTLTPYEEADRNTYPMPEGSSNGSKTLTVTVKQGERSGSEEFGDIQFTEPGTYNYRVEEVQESEAGFIYDGTVYRIEYVVTQQSGSEVLDVQRTIYRVSGTSGSEVTQGRDVATFSNEYNPSKASKTNVSKSSGSTGGSTPSRTSTSSTGSGTGSNTKSGRVKTGDTTRIGLYFGMLAGAAALLVILGAARRRKSNGE